MTAPAHWSGGLPRVAGGAIAATVGTAAPDHWSHGLPFESDGGLAVEYADPVGQLGRWPLTVNGRVAIDAVAVDHTQGGMPYTAAGRVAVSRRAVARTSGGLPRGADGGLAVQDYYISAPLLLDLLAVGEVAAAPIYAGTTADRLVMDHEGVFRRVNTGEPRFWGARRVENLCADAAVTAVGGTGTVEEVSAGVYRVRNAGTTYGDGARSAYGLAGVDVSGRVFVGSCYMRASATSGAGRKVRFQLQRVTGGSGATGAINTEVTLTKEWRRYSTSVITCGTSNLGVGLRFYGADPLETDEWEIKGCQIEEIGGASVQAPGEYVDPAVDYYGNGLVTGCRCFDTANGNSVNAATAEVTGSLGAALSTVKGMLFEAAAANVLASSNLLSWTIENATAAASTEIGPDGRYSAVTLNEGTATATWHRFLGSATVVAEDDRVLLHACMKKGAGSDTAGILGCNNDSAYVVYAVFNLDDGTVPYSASSGTGTVDSYGSIELGNGWWWCWLAFQCTTVSDDTGIEPWISTGQNDQPIASYTGANRTLHVALPMLHDTGAATAVDQAPRLFVPAGSSLTADIQVDFGDITGLDGGLFSSEVTRYTLTNSGTLNPDADRWASLHGVTSSGLVSYCIANNRQSIAYNGVASTTTPSDAVSDFAKYRLDVRHRISMEAGAACYNGQATTEAKQVDATPVDLVSDFGVSDLLVARGVSLSTILSGVTVWPNALGQAWAEESR